MLDFYVYTWVLQTAQCNPQEERLSYPLEFQGEEYAILVWWFLGKIKNRKNMSRRKGHHTSWWALDRPSLSILLTILKVPLLLLKTSQFNDITL